VIRYAEEPPGSGMPKRVIWKQQFGTYEEAQQHVREHPSPNIAIGGINPLRSCVPLSKLGGYRLVFTSQKASGGSSVPLRAVKIFESVP